MKSASFPTVRLPFKSSSKAAVAAHLNLTPEHFSRLLHELADGGLSRVDGRRITVLQPQALATASR